MWGESAGVRVDSCVLRGYYIASKPAHTAAVAMP